MAIDPKQLFIDERLRLETCVYCGGLPETREHIPPKIFLDHPHPEDLPVVPACFACNNQKSSDEEYLVCFLECVVCGTTEIGSLERDKIKKALLHSPKLQSKIESTKKYINENQLIWEPEQDRVRSLAIKLAQGHIAYEEFAILEQPADVFINPLCTLPVEMEDLFYSGSSAVGLAGWPEIGSRGFIRACNTGNIASWIEAQEGRYRYKIIASSAVAIVIREYLGIYVAWE